ncbi:hypothetical protein NON08_00250 [Cetobacterium somerae]|uniref:hypothetical protein n=1 Tax=Cetobacterium sp. NK01 TaxID=2993530 RepID=UPI002115F88C|nr:hypothetical protein [Cetobacterium sp. NK01]MCQ8211001.1 hypothetical protein [Cetobacterium sp. NK01]
MYRIILLENEEVVLSKEIESYDETFDNIKILINQLNKNKKIMVQEKRDDKWANFGEWELE